MKLYIYHSSKQALENNKQYQR